MRGTPCGRVGGVAGVRIIPADAGNTITNTALSAKNWDHPRGCGEHYGDSPEAEADHGSSPRMRGTPHGRRNTCRKFGIIPADAGNTLPHGRRCGACPDHPRGCGEHNMLNFPALRNEGSSPRMRGTLSPFSMMLPPPWIIPTDAGNTL